MDDCAIVGKYLRDRYFKYFIAQILKHYCAIYKFWEWTRGKMYAASCENDAAGVNGSNGAFAPHCGGGRLWCLHRVGATESTEERRVKNPSCGGGDEWGVGWAVIVWIF